MKREVFLVANAEVGRFPDTEAGLLDRLAHDERYILEHHPHAAAQSWRALAKVGGKPRDGIAAHMIERLYELRDALGDPSTPVWKAARLGISYQNLVMVYRQPLNQKNVGAVVRKGQPGRAPNHDLPLRVLKALKGSGMTWKEILRRFDREPAVGDIVVSKGAPTRKGRRWIFTEKSRAGKILSSVEYAESTLETKIFPKA